MNNSVCLYNARSSDSVRSSDLSLFLSEALDKHIADFGEPPEAIYLTSSIELALFAFEDVTCALIPFLKSFSGTKIKVVTQGCLGLFAGIMSFNSEEYLKSVLIFSIESPGKFIQDGLNTVGIGNLPGQDGLEISPSIGSISLLKKTQSSLLSGDVVIDSCDIVSLPTSLSQQAFSIVKMAKNLISLLDDSHGRLVSFEVSAPWSKAIFSAIKSMVVKKRPDAEWLKSVEQDHKHYMTVKQILELIEYKSEISSKPLIMTGLGVGGRFGVLRIASSEYAYENKISTPIEEALDFREHVTMTRGVILGTDVNKEKLIKKNILSYDKKYRGLDNQVFSWDLELSVCEDFTGSLALEEA
jgi:hypothetical protein